MVAAVSCHGLFGPALGCALALWLARRWATSPLARNWLLIVLRAVVLGLLVSLALESDGGQAKSPSPPQPAEMVYLVDCSQSMGLDRPISRLDQVKDDDPAKQSVESHRDLPCG